MMPKITIQDEMSHLFLFLLVTQIFSSKVTEIYINPCQKFLVPKGSGHLVLSMLPFFPF